MLTATWAAFAQSLFRGDAHEQNFRCGGVGCRFRVDSSAQMGPAMTGDSEGKVLTDSKGMTLYVFDKDADGKSVCNGPCATNWPPLMVSGDAKADGP